MLADVMRVALQVQYAVHGIFDLAYNDDGSPIQLKEIGERQGIPARYLEQIFQRLRRAGLVTSKRGPGGGYKLSRDSATIRLMDVFEAIDGQFKIAECLLSRQVCDRQKCIFGNLLNEVGTSAYNHFSKTTLAMLIESGQST